MEHKHHHAADLAHAHAHAVALAEGAKDNLHRVVRAITNQIRGAIRSAHDPTDIKAEAVYERRAGAAPTPKTLDYRPQLRPVRDQGDKQGSCVAHVAACMKEWQELSDSRINTDFAPQFVYNLRDNPSVYGMTGRDCMKILQRWGMCFERTYPYGKVEPTSAMPKAAFDEGVHFKINTYARVYSVEGVKTALTQNGPCLFLVPCYNDGPTMWRRKNDGTDLDEDEVFGHAMTFVGFTDTAFIVRNQWGPMWADRGYCYLPFSDWSSVWEVWTCTDDLTAYKPPGLATIAPNSLQPRPVIGASINLGDGVAAAPTQQPMDLKRSVVPLANQQTQPTNKNVRRKRRAAATRKASATKSSCFTKCFMCMCCCGNSPDKKSKRTQSKTTTTTTTAKSPVIARV